MTALLQMWARQGAIVGVAAILALGLFTALVGLWWGIRPFVRAIYGQREQSGLSRDAFYIALVAVTLALGLGYLVGTVRSTRANTYAIQSYVDGRDFERQAFRQEELARLALANQIQMAACNSTIESQKRVFTDKSDAEARKTATQIADLDKAQKAMAQDYSTTILGLRQQLHEHGITERILAPVATR